MADDLSTDVSQDTSVNSDEMSGSDDGELEDIEVDLSELDSQDEEEQQADDSDEDDEAEEASEEPAADDEQPEEEDTESDTPELTEAEREAEHRRQMYEQRQAEKQARIDKVKADQAEYISEASEEGDPHEIALRQLQVDAYNNKVEAVENKLTNGYERALTDFPVLKTNDPVVQAEIDAAIDAFQAQYVTVDAYGNATDVRGDLYATLQAKADSIEKLTGIRAKRQEQSKKVEKSKTLVAPRRAPQEPKVDPDIAAFDEEAYS